MSSETSQDRYEGTDYVCPNCGCEIMVKHSGDPSKMQGDGGYTCRCGTRMQMEHSTVGAGARM